MSNRRTIWSDTFLSPDEIEIVQLARAFAQKEILPIAADIDRKHEIPSTLVKSLGEMGFLGMMVPEEWGGGGMSTRGYSAVLEEISVACASTAVLMSVNNSLVCNAIARFGSDAQKKKYLMKVATGEMIGCYCLSEPGSGSDAGAMKTRAVKKGDKWILNGVKNFITNGKEAGIAIVYAISNPEIKKGVTCFLVDTNTKGYQIAKIEEKLGIRGSSTAQIVLENIELSDEQRLGGENEGFKIAMSVLDGGRIGIAAQAIGIARACLEEAAIYALEREAFGKPIADFQSIQNYIADMSTQIDAARLLMRAAATQRDLGQDYSRAASQAKYFASDMCMQAAVKGIQVLGGYGYTTDYPMERHFRDAKITEIYEGTNEIQRVVIARSIFKALKN